MTVADIDEWDAELLRSRPGDNIMLVSLSAVAEQALFRLAELAPEKTAQLSAAELETLWSLLEPPGKELDAIKRSQDSEGRVRCSAEILWEPDEQERTELLDEWTSEPGDLWFFDIDVLSQPDADHGGLPRGQWPAQHGDFVLDVYMPNSSGQIPTGGVSPW